MWQLPRLGPPLFADCYVCNTALCNTLTPSAIACFARSASTASGSNGSLVECATGVTTCYAYSVGLTKYAGCGVCNRNLTADCVVCSGSNGCNSIGPSTSAAIIETLCVTHC
uniref:Variant-specific surface protein n=1 Tax=Macrostomum lignano TaxID=282301 RepID=A0A1I8FR48_9PLAT